MGYFNMDNVPVSYTHLDVYKRQLQDDAQAGLGLIPGNLVVLDVSFFFQDAGHCHFYLRARQCYLLVASQQPVADSIQHIRNGIGHHSVLNSIECSRRAPFGLATMSLAAFASCYGMDGDLHEPV